MANGLDQRRRRNLRLAVGIAAVAIGFYLTMFVVLS